MYYAQIPKIGIKIAYFITEVINMKTNKKNVILSSILILGSVLLLIGMFGIPGEGPETITVSSGKAIVQPHLSTLDDVIGLSSIEDAIAKFYIIKSKAVTNMVTLSKAPVVAVDNAVTLDRFHNVWIEKVVGEVKVTVVTPPTVTSSGGKLKKISYVIPAKKKKPESSSKYGYMYQVYYVGCKTEGGIENPRLLDKINCSKDPKNICVITDDGGRLYVVYPGNDFKEVRILKLDESGNILLKNTIPKNATEPFRVSGCMVEGKLIAAYEEGYNIRLKILDINLNSLAELSIYNVKDPKTISTSDPETIILAYEKGGNLCSKEIYIEESKMYPGEEINVEDNIDAYSATGAEDTQVMAIRKGSNLLLKESLEEPSIVSKDNVMSEPDNVIVYLDLIETDVVSYVKAKIENIEELKVTFCEK